MVKASLALAIITTGLICLGISWFSRRNGGERFAAWGWIFTGFYFFLDSDRYIGEGDPLLLVFSAAALPAGFALAVWEMKANEDNKELQWFRGAVFWSATPYLLFVMVPWLNAMAIWFVAWQSMLFLQWSGGGDISIGETYVNTSEGRHVFSDWVGSNWLMLDQSAEYPIQAQLLSGGDPIGINFVLACTALQSMIIFVGAIISLDIDWRRKARALLIVLPVIHLLNMFRNAGLVWLHMNYPDWEFMGLSMFDFGHLYAARIVSLFAMFLIALVLFEILPELHRNVMKLLKPLGIGK